MCNFRRKRERFRPVMSELNEICAIYEERMKTCIRLMLYIRPTLYKVMAGY